MTIFAPGEYVGANRKHPFEWGSLFVPADNAEGERAFLQAIGWKLQPGRPSCSPVQGGYVFTLNY